MIYQPRYIFDPTKIGFSNKSPPKNTMGVILWCPGKSWIPGGVTLRDFTGVNAPVETQMVVDTNVYGSTGFQVHGNEIGIVINSETSLNTIRNLGTVVIAQNVSPVIDCFAKGKKIKFSFDLKVPHSKVVNAGVTQVSAYLYFKDRVNNQGFWYGMCTFDSRGLWHRYKAGFKPVIWDSQGTNVPIANVTAGYDWSVRPFSTAFYRGRKFDKYKSYNFTVGPKEFNNVIARIRARYPTMKLSSNLSDYDWTSANINPEVHAAPGSVAQIGLAVRDWKVELI